MLVEELPNHQQQHQSSGEQTDESNSAATEMVHHHVIDEEDGVVADTVGPDDDLEASDDSLGQICRLCLKLDDLMISIYDRLDPNPNKRPLHERIADMFHVKVSVLI